MKDFKYYSNINVPYPSREDFKRFTLLVNDVVILSNVTETELRTDKHYNDLLHSYEDSHSRQPFEDFLKKRDIHILKKFDEEGYKAAKKAYGLREADLYNEFVKDIAEQFDVVDNPKFNKCFSIAWERGHSSGYYEVYSVFEDLVELIQ